MSTTTTTTTTTTTRDRGDRYGPIEWAQEGNKGLRSSFGRNSRCALQDHLRRLRTEQQKRAMREIELNRRGFAIYHSPYSIESTADGPLTWANKMYRGYMEARWPCSPWWREFIRCVVRIRLVRDLSPVRRFYTLGKVLPYSTPNVGPGADPGVPAVSQQVTLSLPPGGGLPLLSARPAITFPAEERHRPSASTKLYCLVTVAHGCEQHAQGCVSTAWRLGLELVTSESPVRYLSH